MSGNPMNEDDQQLSLLKQDSAHHADRAPTEAARQQSESVVGAVRQQAENTTEAVREQPRPTNNSRGQDRRTDMRFSPIPTHLFEHESRTQA